MSKDLVAIVVPAHKHQFTDEEIFGLNTSLQSFKSRDFYFILPSGLENNFINNTSKKKIYFPKNAFKSISSYNNLLKSRAFYNKFKKYKYILICQPDVIIFKDALNYWCSTNLSYIGPPVFNYFSRSQLNKNNFCAQNGGLSLRNTKDHLKVLELLKNSSSIKIQPRIKYNGFIGMIKEFFHTRVFNSSKGLFKSLINEDIFWSNIIPEIFSFYRVASYEQSKNFALEMHPQNQISSIDENLLVGAHAWYKYDKDFWLNYLKKNKL